VQVAGEELPLIYHLDGRRYVTDAGRVSKGWQSNPDPDKHTPWKVKPNSGGTHGTGYEHYKWW
jgi:hypothetical protein